MSILDWTPQDAKDEADAKKKTAPICPKCGSDDTRRSRSVTGFMSEGWYNYCMECGHDWGWA